MQGKRDSSATAGVEQRDTGATRTRRASHSASKCIEKYGMGCVIAQARCRQCRQVATSEGAQPRARHRLLMVATTPLLHGPASQAAAAIATQDTEQCKMAREARTDNRQWAGVRRRRFDLLQQGAKRQAGCSTPTANQRLAHGRWGRLHATVGLTTTATMHTVQPTREMDHETSSASRQRASPVWVQAPTSCRGLPGWTCH